MKKDKKIEEQQEDLEQAGAEFKDKNEQYSSDPADAKISSESGDPDAEFDGIKSKLEEKSRQCDEYLGKLQRMAAEFDNFKKRTAREKECLYSEAISDTVSAFLPVVDSLERAVMASENAGESQSLKEGIELVFRQLKDVMKKLGVEEIKAAGEAFNPELHNAVMHVEDDTCGENVIVEEFQKGYTLKDRVIRHSMVKVAN